MRSQLHRMLSERFAETLRFEPGFTAEQMGAAVREAIDWAEQHPVEVRAIVQRATGFATRYLNRDAVDCYLLQVRQG